MELRSYVGIPWTREGRSRQGCDCFGLVDLVLAEQYGRSLPSLVGYPESRMGLSWAVDAGRDCGWREIDPALGRAGDVLLFRMRATEWHVGLAVDGQCMLHVSEPGPSGRDRGAVIESYRRPPWSRRIDGVFRWAG